MPNGNIFPANYLQMLKAIVVVYTIKTGMSNIWQLSGGCLWILLRWRQLRQQLVIRSIDGLLMEKNDCFQDIFLFLVYFYIYVDQDFAGFCKGKKWVVGLYHFSLVIRQRTKPILARCSTIKTSSSSYKGDVLNQIQKLKLLNWFMILFLHLQMLYVRGNCYITIFFFHQHSYTGKLRI